MRNLYAERDEPDEFDARGPIFEAIILNSQDQMWMYI